jgi:tryptophanyl-tRNA synthetase
VKKTFIYSDLKYISGPFLMNAWEFSKYVTFNQVRGAFGFNERWASNSIPIMKFASLIQDPSTSCGRIFFPSVQCVAAFATSYPEIWTDKPLEARSAAIAKIPCLIPMGIDQGKPHQTGIE